MNKEKRLYAIDNNGLVMKAEGHNLYVLNNKTLLIYNSDNKTIIQSKEVFDKEGKSRSFIIDGNSIYMKDFCVLYEYDKKSLSLLNKWTLGTDLSSDINKIDSDNQNVYASIRNGTLAVINKSSKEVIYYKISDYSMWDYLVTPDCLYAGNVNGDLLIIGKDDFKVLQSIHLHKKNLKSLYLLNDSIFTASQDLSMKVVDIKNLEIKLEVKNCHKKMFAIIGNCKNYIVTTSPPCGQTKIWNRNDLSLCDTLPFSSWNMIMIGNSLLFDDRNGICEVTL